MFWVIRAWTLYTYRPKSRGDVELVHRGHQYHRKVSPIVEVAYPHTAHNQIDWNVPQLLPRSLFRSGTEDVQSVQMVHWQVRYVQQMPSAKMTHQVSLNEALQWILHPFSINRWVRWVLDDCQTLHCLVSDASSCHVRLAQMVQRQVRHVQRMYSYRTAICQMSMRQVSPNEFKVSCVVYRQAIQLTNFVC